MLTTMQINRHIPPKELRDLKKNSERLRKGLIKEYLALPSLHIEACMPPYLNGHDIISSHIKRSQSGLTASNDLTEKAGLYRLWTLRAIGGYRPAGESAALTEICIGAIAEILEVKARLQVAAGFFSMMVAAVDDYIDKEGTYEVLGERLPAISHAYRDLMDMALEGELEAGTINKEELLEIKLALFEVIKTLISSEDIKAAPAGPGRNSTESASEYLYRKSCGDKVIGVLLPASKESAETKKICCDIGRITGEAGQLLDDAMDYYDDLSSGKKNFIIMTAQTPARAIDFARDKIQAARELASALPPEKDKESLFWILSTLDEVAAILGRSTALNLNTGPGALSLSASLISLLGRAVPTNTFLIWF